MFYIVLFLLGLGFGSFLNVISLRYKPEQKPRSKASLIRGGLFDLKIIGGRSRCPHCHKQLVWYELIPIFSFLFIKGKCRHCGHRLSLQYPLIEFLTALIFVLVPFHFNQQLFLNSLRQPADLILNSFIWIFIFELLLLLAIIDFRHYIIPDEINILLAILGIVLIILNVAFPGYYNLKPNTYNLSFLGHYSLLFGSLGNIWVNHILAAILAMVFFGLIIVISRGRGMGIGDLKLGGALGLIFGWPDLLLVLALSFIVGATVSIILMLKKTKTMKDVVPFGPFLAIGAALTFFLGYNIINAYFKLFGM